MMPRTRTSRKCCCATAVAAAGALALAPGFISSGISRRAGASSEQPVQRRAAVAKADGAGRGSWGLSAAGASTALVLGARLHNRRRKQTERHAEKSPVDAARQLGEDLRGFVDKAQLDGFGL
ncbi:unnamed protein product [Symbiodinium sp. CCMP2592]|nr:unnamed protein product [Symbiodinium sp. CCMP2592]